MKVELKPYEDALTWRNKLARLAWGMAWATLFRPFGGPLFKRWRIMLLRGFGATIGSHCAVAASVRVWAPWNLTLGDYVAIGPGATLYSVDRIVVGSMATISQRAHLCTASHDVTRLLKPLIHRPIALGNYTWVAAEAFVGMGVTVGEGAVIGARAVVAKDVSPWMIAVGNPAKAIKRRTLAEGGRP